MKKVSLLVIALALAFLLPGCGGETSVWQETPVAPQKNDSLTFVPGAADKGRQYGPNGAETVSVDVSRGEGGADPVGARRHHRDG